MTKKIVPVILAGGQGTRLWPISRATRPKQVIEFMGNRSLFQTTLDRLSGSESYEAPIVLTNAEYRFVVSEQAKETGIELGAILLARRAQYRRCYRFGGILRAQPERECCVAYSRL